MSVSPTLIGATDGYHMAARIRMVDEISDRSKVSNYFSALKNRDCLLSPKGTVTLKVIDDSEPPTGDSVSSDIQPVAGRNPARPSIEGAGAMIKNDVPVASPHPTFDLERLPESPWLPLIGRFEQLKTGSPKEFVTHEPQ